MGLILQKSGGGGTIPPGEKVPFRIVEAYEDWGDHGPQARFELEVPHGEYKGTTITEWASLAQPRTDFVKALRGKNYDDEAIADILRKRGFEFDAIDEPESEIGLSSGGKLFNIAMCAFGGRMDYIDSMESVEALLEALKGRTFVSVTKNRGTDGKYTGITWDQVYTDDEADFDDIPF